MSRSKVLVTGGAGFIGLHLVRGLLDAGYDVRVMDIRLRSPSLVGMPVSWLQFDARELPHHQALLEDIDVIYHLAAIPSVARSIAQPMQTHEANATGTLAVLMAARDAGVRRVVYASSSSVYGGSMWPGDSVHEGYMLHPRSPYAISKLAGEQYCEVFREMGLETVSLRYFNVYGRGQSPDSEYAALIPRWMKAMEEKSPLVIYGDGYQSRDFTYIKDVVRATMLAGESEAQGVFNVGTGHNWTLRSLARLMGEIWDREPEVVYEPARPGDVKHSLAGVTKAGRELGFKVAWNIATGLKDMMEETNCGT